MFIVRCLLLVVYYLFCGVRGALLLVCCKRCVDVVCCVLRDVCCVSCDCFLCGACCCFRVCCVLCVDRCVLCVLCCVMCVAGCSLFFMLFCVVCC